MRTPDTARRMAPHVTRRELLQAGLAAGATFALRPLAQPPVLWGGEPGQPKRGGILRVRGFDPPSLDSHLTTAGFTQSTLGFVYSKLVRHKVGADIPPGTFIIEPDLAERWEELDDTTYVFHLRQGVKWHQKSPVNGRELVAEDVKFTYDRFLTEKGNTNRYLLDSVDRVEVVDRYTVKFLLKEPYVWFISVLAYPMSTWIIAPEVVEQYGDLRKVETAIGTGPFILERYEPNVKTVFTRNPDYYRDGQPYVDGVEWLVLDDESTALAMYRTGQIDAGPWAWWAVRQPDLDSLKPSQPHLRYQDFLLNAVTTISMRTDTPPFNDVRVRRAISQASIARRSSTASTCEANRVLRSPEAWPSGRCPSSGLARGPSIIGTLPRRRGSCWRGPAIPRVLKPSCQPPGAMVTTSSTPCSWSYTISKRSALRRS
jgi:ABC-type transport system substrate-binding protein